MNSTNYSALDVGITKWAWPSCIKKVWTTCSAINSFNQSIRHGNFCYTHFRLHIMLNKFPYCYCSSFKKLNNMRTTLSTMFKQPSILALPSSVSLTLHNHWMVQSTELNHPLSCGRLWFSQVFQGFLHSFLFFITVRIATVHKVVGRLG